MFDNNVEGLLAEISLNNDGDTPQEELLEKFPSKVREKKRMEKVYKLDTAIYGIATEIIMNLLQIITMLLKYQI